MNIFSLLRQTIAPFFVALVLSFNSLSISAIPIQPGIQVLADIQFQACLDEAVQANGWTLTEQVTELVCPNHNIEILEGIQVFTNLVKLDLSGNKVFIPSPLDQLPQLEVLDLSDNQLIDVYSLKMMHQLKQLNLSGNELLKRQDVEIVIWNNLSLTHIGVGHIAMGDLSWLPQQGMYGEYNLVELDISYTGQFFDLLSIAQYTNLRVLNVAGNQLVSVHQLDQLQQLEELNLSENTLTDVYSLQMLHNLIKLNLSNNVFLEPTAAPIQLSTVKQIIQANPGLTHLGLAGIYISELFQLNLGVNLIELDISNTDVSDLASLNMLQNLRVLKASGNSIAELFGLDLLQQLEILDLSYNELVNITPLQTLYNLTQLNLTGNNKLQALDVQMVIQHNPGLTHIGVGSIAMNDLFWLPPVGPQGEYNLVELDISNTMKSSAFMPYMDLYPVAQYTNLRVLKAAGNQLTMAFPSYELSQLEVLDLSDNQLMDVYSLEMMRQLKQLNLSGNSQLQALNVKNIIQANMGLTHLGVSGIAMGDLSWLPLQGMYGEYNLVELDISYTGQFYDLMPLLQYTHLRELNVAGNQIETVYPLEQMQQLEVLNLSDNKLLNVLPLSNILSLKILDLSGNNNIQCDELDALEAQLFLDIFYRPASCIFLTPPEVMILSPLNIEPYFNTSIINFNANANDFEDGNLDLLIQWSSNRDGILGNGASLNKVLSAGNHIITASVTDSHGNASVASVNLVVMLNTVPELIVDWTLNGSIFVENELVSLFADAIDVEDGNISFNIQWSSDVDGFLGTGVYIQKILSAGSHVITASITDYGNATVTQSTSITIIAPPQLTIQASLNNSLIQQGDGLAFMANAIDLEDGNISQNIIWTSNLDGLLGMGSLLFQELTTSGEHVITASITDSHGLTVKQSVRIIVNAQPQLVLQAPVNGALFMLQEITELSATANDIEDGNISQNIQWTSSIDGFLGMGEILSKQLSLGTHILTASIADTQGGVHSVTKEVVIDQIDLTTSVSGKGRKRIATLTWAGARTQVDIFQNGMLKDTAASSGTVEYKFKDQATFQVCESGTNYCSIERLVQ